MFSISQIKKPLGSRKSLDKTVFKKSIFLENSHILSVEYAIYLICVSFYML
jgi:hypothetical protein